MFDSLNKYFSELENSAEYTKEFVRKLQGGVRRTVNSLARADKEINLVNNERTYVARLKEEYKKEAIKLAKNSLFDATVNAIKKRQEFDIPIYRRALFEAIENNDTYLYRPSGVGFNSILRVDIDLNRTAGRLDIWGTAVKRTRKQLKVDIPSKHSRKKTREKSALQASRAWARIYNQRGVTNEYINTINLRMKNAAKKGAFWELLDKGTIPISSDRGGYPTPKNNPLNFVDRVEKEINQTLSESFKAEKERYNTLIENYKIARANVVDELVDAIKIVNEISIDAKKIGTLSRRAEKIFKAQYEEKLIKAIELIKRALSSSKKLELAIKGSYKGKRFSNETIQELLQ